VVLITNQKRWPRIRSSPLDNDQSVDDSYHLASLAIGVLALESAPWGSDVAEDDGHRVAVNPGGDHVQNGLRLLPMNAAEPWLEQIRTLIGEGDRQINHL
jgi:hypothetical protein